MSSCQLTRLCLAAYLLTLLSACAGVSPAPVQLADGLAVASPQSQAIDGKRLASAHNNIWEPRSSTITPNIRKMKDYVGIDSMLVARNNKLIFEKYYNGFGIDRPHYVASLGKSLFSALLGVVIDKGLIAGTEQSIYELMPYQDIAHWNADKQAIQVKHLLTMSTGWQCGSILDYDTHCGALMEQQQDPFKWILDLPMAATPGSQFNYNDATPKFIAASMALATRQAPAELYRKHFVDPMQMQNNLFENQALTSREMLKFGLLFLNGGRWQEQQILSPDWVSQSTSIQFEFPGGRRIKGYGYYWWIGEFQFDNRTVDGFYAAGNGGQYIMVIPQFKLVSVFTGSAYNATNYMQQAFEIMERFILPAVQ